jgi:hypothetical protein
MRAWVSRSSTSPGCSVKILQASAGLGNARETAASAERTRRMFFMPSGRANQMPRRARGNRAAIPLTGVSREIRSVYPDGSFASFAQRRPQTL